MEVPLFHYLATESPIIFKIQTRHSFFLIWFLKRENWVRSETDISDLIGEIWRCGTIVLFCPTYNMTIYPPMENLTADMAALSVQNRRFAIAQNGSWAPASGKLIAERLEKLKNCTISENMLTIKGALSKADTQLLEEFIDSIIE